MCVGLYPLSLLMESLKMNVSSRQVWNTLTNDKKRSWCEGESQDSPKIDVGNKHLLKLWVQTEIVQG